MLKDFDDGKAQILITLDFSSAFDCIRVNQLAETLEEEFGFKETALKLLKSYFTGRSYVIELDGIKSDRQPLEIGTGQGSTLSCKGFALATNQLNLIPGRYGLICFQYCDDLSILITFLPGDNFERVKEKILGCLNDILEYCLSHGLALNCDKTHGLVITKEKTAKKVKELLDANPMEFDGEVIKFENEIELLGIPLRADLKLDEFVNEKAKNARKS